jgi:hypothetical protein
MIVDTLEEPEESDLVAVSLVVEPIADGRDAPEHYAIPLSQEVLRLSVLEKGVLGSREEELDVSTQRRDPDRVPRV